MDWKTFFEPVVRHALTGFGLWLVGHHMLVAVDPSVVQVLTGVCMTLAGLAWSVGQKKGWFGSAVAVFIVVVFASGAGSERVYAADMPPTPQVVRKAFVAPASQPWAGLYLGINGAGAKARGEFSMLAIPGTGDVRPSGAMAGVTIGAGAWLNGLYVGAEADGDYDFSKAHVACGFALTTCKMRDGFLLTQRILIGATLPGLMTAAQQRGASSPAQWPVPLNVPANLSASTLLPYLTAGIAERRTQACIEAIGCNKEWLIGWTAGGGIKLPVSAAVSIDVGYLYVNWNRHFNPAGAAVFPTDFKAVSEHVLKAGVQFHL